MRSVNRHAAIPLAVALIVGFFFLAHFVEGHSAFDAATVGADIELAATLTAVAIGCFLWFGWKVKSFRPWLVLVPDLEGCWTGTITPGDAVTRPLAAVAQIRQSLSQVSVIIRTEKARSNSFGGTIANDDASGEHWLVYAYTGDATLDSRGANPRHDGAANLLVTNNGERLEGEYWTSRLTRGMMRFERMSLKTVGDPEAVLRGLIVTIPLSETSEMRTE